MGSFAGDKRRKFHGTGSSESWRYLLCDGPLKKIQVIWIW